MKVVKEVKIVKEVIACDISHVAMFFKGVHPLQIFSLSAEVCDPAANAVIVIPSMSYDGISTLPLTGDINAGHPSTQVAGETAALVATSQAFVSTQCGGLFGAYGTNVPVLLAATPSVLGRVATFPATSTRTRECLVCKCTL